MLQAIRDKVTGWIAYGIIFLITIPFALWGVNSYLGGGEVLPAATVDGEDISPQQFDQAYNNYRQRLMQLFGGSIPEALGNETVLRTQVLDQLVEEAALRQYIEKHHYRIGDEALARSIRGMEQFRRDGKFDPEVYAAQVRSMGLTPLAFEQRLRLADSMDQFHNGLRETAFVTPSEMKQYAELKNQKRKIRSLRYRLDPASVKIESSEIEQYFLAHSDRYRTPEQVRINYIELSLDSIKKNIVVSEEDLRARYQDRRESYTTPEFRKASHILIKVDDTTDEAAALAKISKIRERIEKGESFDALATEYSEDPVSAAKGGSLGKVGKGDMVPAFEAALFSLPVGEVSEPVRTQFGWHLILVQSKSGGETKPFASVKSMLADEIKTERAEVQIYDYTESLANIAYEQPNSLQPAAQQFGFSVQTSDWFDRSSGTGIAADAKVRQQAFSDEILEQGLNSEAIELSGQRVVFIRVNDRRPPQAQTLEQVRDQVKSELVKQKLSEGSLKAGTEALQKLKSGAALEDVASEWSAPIKDLGFIERNQAQIDPLVLRRSFTMPRPNQGVVYDGLSVGSGEYAIIELSAVISNSDKLDKDTVDKLEQAQGEAEYQSALKYLGSRAEVVKTPLDQIQF
jgi:peptidyl-prolyl cis-trans isomerase D